MKRTIILIIVTLFIIISCENKNKTGKVLETEIEAKTENNINEAVINADCDYWK